MWRQIEVFSTLYRTKGGDEILIHTIKRPPRTRTLRSAGGRRKYTAVAIKRTTREFIVMAKATKKKSQVDEITDDELEELEGLEELEDEDEDEDETEAVEPDDDEEDDEDDEDEEPAPKKKSKKGKAKTKRPSRASQDGLVGTQEVAAHCGIDGRTLRMVLRKHKIAKDEDTGRYQWDSLKDPEVKKIKKLVDAGEAKAVKQEGLDKLKARNEAKKDAKAKTKKSGKGKKKKPVFVEDDDDE